MPHWTLYLWKGDFWTDGVETSDRILHHVIYNSPIDAMPFWIDDCEIISPEDFEKTEVMVMYDRDDGSDTSAKSIRFSDRGVPTIAGSAGITPDMLPCPWAYTKYKSAFEAGMGDTPGREMYLRLRIWFEANDALRADRSKQMQPEDLENLERLAELYERTYSSETVLRAEVLRQLSRFDEAIDVLNRELAYSHLSADYRHIAATILNLAKDGNSRLAIVPKPALPPKSPTPALPPKSIWRRIWLKVPRPTGLRRDT